MLSAAPSQVDRFGNAVDPTVGYAWGDILSSSLDEVRRLGNAWALTRQWAATFGADSLAIFTGMSGRLDIDTADIALCNEWTGPALVSHDLREAALQHLGGSEADGFGMVARSSAAIVAWLSLVASDGSVISIVPLGGRSHSSVRNGALLARARLTEISADRVTDQVFIDTGARCVVVTPITSSLERVSDAELSRVVDMAHRHHAVVLLDDAYGARLRPILYGGAPSLGFGADVVVTNSDKAGLRGPRGALVAGSPDLVRELVTWAAERGMDARAPILVGALRALQAFDPKDVLLEAENGRRLGQALAQELGDAQVSQGDLGPTISEENALSMVRHRAGAAVHQQLVPCEASAAIGMCLLRRFGIVTVNTHAQPGARVSLRLKPVLDHLARAGGADEVAAHVREAIDEVAELAHSESAVRQLLLGDDHAPLVRR
jgi:L-seryl-tRNA(Ser) seleniumtransferase